MMKTLIKRMDTLLEETAREVAGDLADYPRGVTPREEIWRAGNVSLQYFPSESMDSEATPILFIPSLINRWYILDITPGASFVGASAPVRPTYLLDWGYPGPESQHLPLSHFYHTAIKRAVRQIRRRTGARQVNLLGYCIGGTLAYAYSCLEPADVEKLVLLTAPIDFSDTGVLGMYAETFPDEEFRRSMEYMPGWLLASSFQFIQPMGALQKVKGFEKRFGDPKFKELFVAMERWIADPVNFPARAYVELITDLYQDNRLALGLLETAEGIRVNPAARSCRGLVLNADKDHIAPPACTRLPREDQAPLETVNLPSGHIGITTGRHGTAARRAVTEFLVN